MKKTARKTTQKTQSGKTYVTFTLRLTEDEHRDISKLAKKEGKSITRYLIDSATHKFTCPLTSKD